MSADIVHAAPSLTIGGRLVADAEPPYIIAELGVNHDGSEELARQLIESAAEAGADAVKFQWFEASRLLSREALLAAYQADAGADDAKTMLTDLEMGEEQLAPLMDAAHRTGLHAIVTVFNVELVERAAGMPWDGFKVASPDVVNHPLLDALAGTSRPLLVSTGAAEFAEVQAAAERLRGSTHLFMQCVSAYPTPDAHAALAGIGAMRAANLPALGYSDHTSSIDTGGLAVAAGARVLEKHLTYDRCAVGPDHAASLDPDDFGLYVTGARQAFEMLGAMEKRVQAIEEDVRRVARQSIVAARDLPAGSVLARQDLCVKRPGTGLPASAIESVIGCVLSQDVSADAVLTQDHLA